MPVIMSASTLVETIAINCEDFADSFLTCTTCLCPFDSGPHSPKLLSCSHTVCKSCLECISSQPQVRDTGTVRCPICRESVSVPPGGVAALPPSFLVNQLMDLITRHPRDVIPRCANHPAEELLFCETCDVVFCLKCLDGSAHADGACDHTVVPFAVAIKRVSEILLYKANQCLRNLLTAADNTAQEMERLDANVDNVLDQVNQSFQEVNSLLEQRRQDIIRHVRAVRDEKRSVLQEQLHIIGHERSKVEAECSGLHHQIEVRDITKKINDLNDMLDMTQTLMEPRENAYLRYEYSRTGMIKRLQAAVDTYGALCVSKTFPPLCVVRPETTCVVHLKNSLLLNTVDYHGNPRRDGGDPVEAKLVHVSDDFVPPAHLYPPGSGQEEEDGFSKCHASSCPRLSARDHSGKRAALALSSTLGSSSITSASTMRASNTESSSSETITSASATLMMMSSEADGGGGGTSSSLRLSGLYPSASWLHASGATTSLPPSYGGGGGKSRDTAVTPLLLKGSAVVVPCSVTDLEDGRYRIYYQVEKPGTYEMQVRIFGRPIRNSPLTLHVTPHNEPLWLFSGPEHDPLNQPVRLACGPDGQLYILDAGNQRILSYATFDDGRIGCLSGGESNIADLLGQSCTGMAFSTSNPGSNSLYIVNWRNCAVSELSADFAHPRLLRRFQCSEFREPIDIALDAPGGRILVADNGQGRVYVFQLLSAQFMHSFDVRQAVAGAMPPSPSTASNPRTPPTRSSKSSSFTGRKACSLKEQLYCICVGENGDVIIGGTQISVFSREGRLKSVISPSDLLNQHRPPEGGLKSSNSDAAASSPSPLSGQPSSSSGTFVNGLAVDAHGFLLASVMERHRAYVLVHRLYGNQVTTFAIDSFSCKLRRPTGLCVSHDGHSYVADLGSHSVRKYRYL